VEALFAALHHSDLAPHRDALLEILKTFLKPERPNHRQPYPPLFDMQRTALAAYYDSLKQRPGLRLPDDVDEQAAIGLAIKWDVSASGDKPATAKTIRAWRKRFKRAESFRSLASSFRRLPRADAQAEIDTKLQMLALARRHVVGS
jgi:hypothetical protein